MKRRAVVCLLAAEVATAMGCMNRNTSVETGVPQHAAYEVGPQVSRRPDVLAELAQKGEDVTVRIEATDACTTREVMVAQRRRVTRVEPGNIRWVGAASLAAYGAIALANAVKEPSGGRVLLTIGLFGGSVAAAFGPVAARRVEVETLPPQTTDVPVGLQPCHRRALVKAHVTIMGKTGASDATTDSLGQATFVGMHVSDVTTVFVDNVAVRNVTRSPTE